MLDSKVVRRWPSTLTRRASASPSRSTHRRILTLLRTLSVLGRCHHALKPRRHRDRRPFNPHRLPVVLHLRLRSHLLPAVLHLHPLSPLLHAVRHLRLLSPLHPVVPHLRLSRHPHLGVRHLRLRSLHPRHAVPRLRPHRRHRLAVLHRHHHHPSDHRRRTH